VTAAPPRAPVVLVPRRGTGAPDRARADVATQQSRRLQFTAALAGVRLRSTLNVASSVRRRQAFQLCSAARLLTALGIRVAVVQPEVPWPRHLPHRLRITNDAGLPGELALLTAVPRTTHDWSAVADRVLRVGTPLRPADPLPGGAVECPVTIAYRTEAGPLAAPPRTLNEVVAVLGLVLEVRLQSIAEGSDRAA
jgi:hypothetical protein